MRERVLITGGLGYLGGRISRYLAENTNYYLRLTSHKNKVSLPECLVNTEIVQMDTLNEQMIEKACKGINTIIHLAAMNEVDCANDPERAILTNIVGTFKLLKVAEEAGVEKIIYFSTAHVYGSPLMGEVEETTLTKPITPFAIVHRASEDFLCLYNKRRKMKGIIVRLSNCIGAPVDFNVNRWMLLVNDLCRQAVNNRKLILRSAGLQKRDFITLFDVERAVLHFLKLDIRKYKDNIFNLGGECTMSVIEMARKIADRCEKVMGFKPKITRPRSGREKSSPSLYYNINKLKSTGFTLKGNICKEIDDTLKLCKMNLK